MDSRSPPPTASAVDPDRRGFLAAAAATTLSFALPRISEASVRRLRRPVALGVIADLHHDVMHDGPARLDTFIEHMSTRRPDAIVQLGDFAYPSPDNLPLVARFNGAHPRALHVLGNHDTDAGFQTKDCVEAWGMPGRYYDRDVEGVRLLVLDGNDAGSPNHGGGYPSFVGGEQVAWLTERLDVLEGPIVVASHQPLAGPHAVDNAEEIQRILGSAADKVILAINGHSHIDEIVRVRDVTFLHVNSASYKWVGGDHRHESYPEAIHAEHPWISYTCPYRDPLFATIVVDPATRAVRVEGRRSRWVGASPAELGSDPHPALIHGEQIAPRIRDRALFRA